jgi:hypothetical protein
VSAKKSVHNDQASQEAACRLNPPTPRPCSLAPSITNTTLQHYRL